MSREKKILLSGNEAIAQGAIEAGCKFYAGYPITPQNELIAYMAKYLPLNQGIFIQSESELAAINMVFGAAATGVRAMTSSSSPGISLMQEGISYIAGANLPAVIVNIMRAGPGLGNIWPAQSDYFQATRGGGHGDYHCIVLAPSTAQEALDLTALGFDLGDKYLMPAIILGDGMLGQMMEPVRGSGFGVRGSGYGVRGTGDVARKKWALTGCQGRKPSIVKSFYLKFGDLEEANLRLQKKYALVKTQETREEDLYLNDAEVILVAYGTMARLAKEALWAIRKKGLKVGFIRPISLWPFPAEVFKRLAIDNKRLVFLVVEMSYGQMLEDVKLALNGMAKVEFLGRSGGGIPTVEQIIERISRFVH